MPQLYAECRESHFVLDKINRMPYSFLRIKSPQGGFSNDTKLALTNERLGWFLEGKSKNKCICIRPEWCIQALRCKEGFSLCRKGTADEKI